MRNCARIVASSLAVMVYFLGVALRAIVGDLVPARFLEAPTTMEVKYE